MRIAIVGAGGVGGLLGGLLARAGAEVTVVARGAALEAIRARGLRVDSPLGAFEARVAASAEDPAELPPADAVLVAVKAWQVAELGRRRGPAPERRRGGGAPRRGARRRARRGRRDQRARLDRRARGGEARGGR